MRWDMRDIHLRILASIASSNETMAYYLHESTKPRDRAFADRLMENSQNIKRLFKEQLKGAELDVYMSLTEGQYTPPKEQK